MGIAACDLYREGRQIADVPTFLHSPHVPRHVDEAAGLLCVVRIGGWKPVRVAGAFGAARRQILGLPNLSRGARDLVSLTAWLTQALAAASLAKPSVV
jgi:hypothetical protein